ncbi:hypothetical protein [Pedobacter mucosus]|uniref:hypothetical protein n=1 Tax=Pedobacter mucosus TaxID=2895286 RepID=UPI001EE3A8CA|nr:hypothetical protein [Pedobacter mucosus]UKT64662.1 hypothetical protein LOK61_02535 [Pedobacter mucosus]
MRKGRITQANPSEIRGFIQDENEQEISFILNNLDANINVTDNVLFEIQLTEFGLTATNIKLSTN